MYPRNHFFEGRRRREAREASPLWTHRNQGPSYSFTDIALLQVCTIYFPVFPSLLHCIEAQTFAYIQITRF